MANDRCVLGAKFRLSMASDAMDISHIDTTITARYPKEVQLVERGDKSMAALISLLDSMTSERPTTLLYSLDSGVAATPSANGARSDDF